VCGIAGYLRSGHTGPLRLTDETRRSVLESLRHRGPDAEGDYASHDGRCWLGFRRLAIVDLETGDQPMSNEDGTVWLVYNGEIYNFPTLRGDLERCGHSFRTRADSEVLLHGYEEWGMDGLLPRLQGIFAFAIYDERERRISLARDHLGVKPLFFQHVDGTLAFASEIKALLGFPWASRPAVNRAGLAQFLTCRYVSRPDTMFDGIYKLPEAHWMSFGVGDQALAPAHRYWKPSFRSAPDPPSFDGAVELLDGLLRETVGMQLMSDVPVGAQLSGGVDSSLVVAYMQLARRDRGDTEPVHTYSVGFDTPGFSELEFANAVASRWGTVHREITVTAADYLAAFPWLAWIYDEPIGEPPAVPTYLMCERAREDVTVLLCGEGADEQFGGYRKYAFEDLTRYLDWMPASIRATLLRTSAKVLPFSARRWRAVLEILAIDDAAKRYSSWYGAFDTWTQAAILDPAIRDNLAELFLQETFAPILAEFDGDSRLRKFQDCDLQTRLVDDLLVKGDRMSMAASVEARVPLMDHTVVEFAARLPGSYHVRGMETKRLLKRLAERYVPHHAVHRRKVGFTVPLTRWFVGPWARFVRQALLSDQSLERGYFRPDVVRRIVNDHLDQRVDREQGIWVLLAIEMWHRIYVDGDGSAHAAEQVQADLEMARTPGHQGTAAAAA
jgi:asparagine synthase (glutamine-hydrolysing)